MEAPQKPAVVWVVDREHWPRAFLVAELTERGFEARGYEEVGDAVVDLYRLFRDRPAAMVLDLREQPHDAPTLRALLGAGVPVVLVAGALELAEPLVQDLPWSAVLRRPVSVGQICDAVEELVRTRRRPVLER
mgnify:CR=1 FL=1